MSIEIIRKRTKRKPSAMPFLAIGAVLTALLAGLAAFGPRSAGSSSSPRAAAHGPVVPPPYAGPLFIELAADSGLRHVQGDRERLEYCEDSEGIGESCMAKAMSGGAAAGDYDGDGDSDLFMTRIYGSAILYRNKGDGTFEDATADSGIATPESTNGAVWADIDNDDDQDLFVTTIDDQRFHLYINDGSGKFTEQAERRGADLKGKDHLRQGFSIAAGDYDNDGWIDLYTAQWGRGMQITYTRLLRNLGALNPGHFEDATMAAGFSPANNPGFFFDDGYTTDALRGSFIRGRYSGKFAFAPAFADFDGDGWQDLAVTADFGTSRIFWNNGDGTFADGTDAARVGTDENGMGSTIGDVDGDGRPDWFVTSIFAKGERKPCTTEGCMEGTTGNRLYLNAGGRKFTDATDAFGVRDGGWGWGTGLFDYDNDGDQDLVMTNGMTEDPFRDDAMRFWSNDGAGRMKELSADTGLVDEGSGKGLLLFDYDMDGDLDVLIANNTSTPLLYRNDGGNRKDWLRVRARGTRSNRDGLGAKVSVTASGKTQTREIGSGTYFLGQSENVAHFGLGKRSGPTTVDVVWPASGCRQTLTEVEPNTLITVTEPAECQK